MKRRQDPHDETSKKSPERSTGERGSGAGGGRDSSGRDWKIQVRFIMKNSMAGQVIGSRGSTIQKLRDDFDVNVQLYAEEGPERLLFFESLDFDNIMDCICEYAKIMVRDDGYCEHKMLVWKHHAGGIIGNKGETINDLRKTYACNIQMFKECCPQSTDRIVRVAGDLEKVTDCLREIISMVQKMDRPSPGAENRYNPRNHDPVTVDAYGGFSNDRDRYGGGNSRDHRGGGGGGHHNSRDRGDVMDSRGGGGGGHKKPQPIPPPNQMPSYEKLFFLVYGQFPPANYPIPQMPIQMPSGGGSGGYSGSANAGSGMNSGGNMSGQGGGQSGGGNSGAQGGGSSGAVGQNWNRDVRGFGHGSGPIQRNNNNDPW